jgi:hypothetical protein
MAIPSIPDQVDNDPINVQERKIRQVDCPNPECDGVLDITNINVGTKIKCKDCANVTWLPDYGRKWWQKPLSIISGLVVSFIIGVLSSLAATAIQAHSDQNDKNIQSQNSQGQNIVK